MSFLSRLFGSKRASSGPEAKPSEDRTTAQVEYSGYVIRAVPFKANGQYQTAGVIEREIDGVLKAHRFVRADRSTTVDEVTELAIAKGKLIIDQQGDGMFQ